jgi:hypothetical protein
MPVEDVTCESTLFPSKPTLPFSHDIPRDPSKKRGESLNIVDFVESFECSQKDFLSDVVRVVRVVRIEQQAGDERSKWPVSCAHKSGDRTSIATPGWFKISLIQIVHVGSQRKVDGVVEFGSYFFCRPSAW